jgi:hypothetical protein
MATNGVTDSSTDEVYSEAVYQFANSGAADVFYDGLAATWSACHLIVANVTPTEVGRMTVTPIVAPSGVGVQDFAVTMTGTEGIHLSETETVAREGVDVYMAVAGRTAARAHHECEGSGLNSHDGGNGSRADTSG